MRSGGRDARLVLGTVDARSNGMGFIHNVVAKFGHAIRAARAGEGKLLSRKLGVEAAARMVVRSPAFQQGEMLPDRFVSSGDNISPPLTISAIPMDAVELVLICEDPDAPIPWPLTQWVVAGIPPTIHQIAEGLPIGASVAAIPGARQGRNYRGHFGYDGPAPPLGHGIHHYHFQVFALGRGLPAEQPLERDTLLSRLRGNAIGFGEIVALYERV